MGKKKSKRTSKTSSGKHKKSKIRKVIMRTEMKINRWKRYVDEIERGERKGKVSRWNTAGLEKHAEYLKQLL